MPKPLVIITGASSGIGKACALEFSNKGYPLLLLARRIELLYKMNLPNTICRKLDVTDYDNFKAIIDDVAKDFDEIGLLVNNAGIMPLDDYINQDHNTKVDIVNTNLIGVMNGMDCVLPILVKQKKGTIINVSSVAGRWTSIYHSVYNASKAAVNYLSEQVRKEVAKDNVRVLLIEPAIVDTNLLNHVDDKNILEDYSKIKNSIAGGLTANDVAKTISYMYELPENIALKEIVISHTNQKI